ncbi:MAG: DNA polymerase [Eubacteriales bacterium]
MRHLSIDIETFSSVDIKKSGLYKYVQSPDFEVLLFAYSFDSEPVKIIDLENGVFGSGIPSDIITALFNRDVIKHAYNAPFEWYCLSQHLRLTADQSIVWLSQWRCTMFHALYCGYTIGLGATGEALGLPQDKRKLGIGSSLIKTFCVPCKPSASNGNRTRTLPQHEPEKWQLFKEYCVQDVITEMEIERRLSFFPVPVGEQKLWELDQKINAFGVGVDLDLIDGALTISDIINDELMKEAVKISGLENPKSVKQLTEWLTEETGDTVENLKKETVKTMLGTDMESDAARRMLEIRQELSKTSVKKYKAMYEAVCDDGRVRGLLQFYGANRTGRWAGRLVQVQNLPRNYLETLAHARDCIKAKKIEAVKIIYGNVPDTLSQLIRTAFIPDTGNTFLVADFSAIEARVVAWLAGEQWVMDVFATHGKIYEATASQMFGVPIELIKKGNPEYALRQKGKVATLALGYQGATGALIAMGALNMGLTEEELPEIVRRWRQANKRIVDLWYSVENAALEVMRTGYPVGVRGLIIAREGDYTTEQDFLTITLPSGRKLFYVKPFLAPNKWGNDSIHYYGMDQETKKWTTVDTWGGKLVENVVQAIARDCLAVSIQRLEENGFHIAFHVHDEVIIDRFIATDPEIMLEVACGIMGEPIPWAPGLLLRADGFTTEFYKKD